MKKIGIRKNHEYSILKIDQEHIYLSDPYNTAGYIRIDRNDLNKYFRNIYCCLPTQKQIEDTFINDNFLYKKNEIIEGINWWTTKINQYYNNIIENETDINKINEFLAARQILLFNILERDNCFNLADLFIFNNTDPNILFNDKDLLKYFDNINKKNLVLFLKASEIKDKETRLAAYELSSYTDWSNSEIEFKYQKNINDGIQGLLILFEYLKEKPSNIFKDKNIYKYFKKINDINVDLFAKASEINNQETREIACFIASLVKTEENHVEALTLVNELTSNPNTIFDRPAIIRKFAENEFNKEIFSWADKIQGTEEKETAYILASKITNKYGKREALKLIKSFIKENNGLLKDKVFRTHFVWDINDYNLPLFSNSANIFFNKGTNDETRYTYYIRFSNVDDKRSKVGAFSSFSLFYIKYEKNKKYPM